MVSDIFPTGPKYFQIQLENDTFHSYVAGQTIIGRVVVELKDKLKILAMKIELLGKGVIHWEREHYYVDNGNRSRSREANTLYLGRISAFHCRSPRIPEEETYIYQAKYLIGERVETPVTLPPGVNSFPFFFTLSPWLPSSFEGRHCHIRYSLQVTLERALFRDLKSEPLTFLIKGILDLNQYPTIARPVNVCENKSRDLLCWKLWSVALNLNIEKTGFIPGETLKFSVKFNNSCSNVKLTLVKAYLIQKVTVRAPIAECSYDKKLVKVTGPMINAGEIENWDGQLEIPHVEPSGLGLYPSKVLRFNIQYYLKITVKNVFSTISRKVGLTIGTIPLRDGRTNANTNVSASSEVIYCGGQHFTPYNNLSEIFPPMSVNIGNNNRSTSSLRLHQNACSTRNITNTQESNSASVPVSSPLDEESRNGISSSLTILPESVKFPLTRTDTPPPSYEEAIKKPSKKS